jgi:hypothetical protein
MADLDQEQQQALEQLEADLQAMQWEEVSLDPDAASWQDIEQELPVEWTELEAERAFTQEELQALLDAEIDASEGDIDQNAEQALQELELDLDALVTERESELDLDLAQPEQERDLDR